MSDLRNTAYDGPDGIFTGYRELAISERPLSWLLARHAELLNFDVCFVHSPACPGGCEDDLVARGDRRFVPVEIRVELESIEDEIMDRDDMKELGLSRLTDDERAAVQVVLERGWNR